MSWYRRGQPDDDDDIDPLGFFVNKKCPLPPYWSKPIVTVFQSFPSDKELGQPYHFDDDIDDNEEDNDDDDLDKFYL